MIVFIQKQNTHKHKGDFMKHKILTYLMGLLISTQSMTVEVETVLIQDVSMSPRIVEIQTIYPEHDIEEECYMDQLELLAALVEAEAGNQDLMGRRLVVDVVLNRIDSDDFPDDIASVIYDDGEFSPVSDGRIDEVSISEESFKAVELELANRTNSDILYFRTKHYHTFGTPVMKHGAHYFSK
jgi:spore germination cell wall hydrolase CwlJ-like protein